MEYVNCIDKEFEEANERGVAVRCEEGGDVPSTGQRGQFHMMDREGPPTFHIVE